MPLFVQPPFPHDVHLREVRRCRGTACYGALVVYFCTESPKELEWLIDEKKYVTKDGDPTGSNTYRRWRQGKLPHPSSIEKVRSCTDGEVQLGRWRNLMLWELLEPTRIPPDRLRTLLGQLPCVAVLMRSSSGREQPFGVVVPNKQDARALRNLRSLDAFLALLCYARFEEWNDDGDEELHWFCARSAFYIFPNVLDSEPALGYRWENLCICLQRIFWRGLYLRMPLRSLKMDWVIKQLAALKQDRLNREKLLSRKM